MTLAHLQRTLACLIKGTHEPCPADPPYIAMIAQSPHLEIVREVVSWWRAFDVARFCTLTSTLLRHEGLFDEALDAFVRKGPVSPFVETAGTRFLEDMSTHPDSLVRSVARFELAVLRIKSGDRGDHVVDWEYDPGTVLDAIVNGGELDREAIRGSHRTIVSFTKENRPLCEKHAGACPRMRSAAGRESGAP
jgi:hypothetical protein